MSSNMEQYGETGEREGEAQNTTLHAKFSKKTSIDPSRKGEREGEAQNTTLHDKFSKFLTKS